MCGYVAHVDLDGTISATEAPELKEWLMSLSHRGPDYTDIYRTSFIEFGHARLEIIGGSAGVQPIRSQHCAMVYNGELYDFQQQQQRLSKKFSSNDVSESSNSDTSTLFDGLSLEGPDFLTSVNGMFSGVFWDSRDRSCYLFRDRFGIKPIYFFRSKNKLWVSSELHALKSHLERINIKINTSEMALCEYLELGYVVEPRTWFDGLFAVQPGEVIRFSERGIEKSFIWSPLDCMSINRQGTVRDIHDLLLSSIESHKPKNQNYHVFLSGGIDSSLIMSGCRSDSHVHASSVRFGHFGNQSQSFDPNDFDHHMAYRLATLYDIPMFESVNIDMDIFSHPEIQYSIFKEPFSDLAGVPTAALAKTCSQNSKIALSGDGADELFFGYRNHRLLSNEQKIRAKIPSFLMSALRNIAPLTSDSQSIPRIFRFKRTLESITKPISMAYLSALSLGEPGRGLGLLRHRKDHQTWQSDLFNELCSYKSVDKNSLTDALSFDPMKIIQWLDLSVYLPSCVLKKADRATMHHGIEARVPFLDKSLSEYALSCNSSNQIKFESSKLLLRTVAEKHLPAEWCHAPKRSFTPPQHIWMRKHLNSPQGMTSWVTKLKKSPWISVFSLSQWIELLNEHAKGKANHSPLIWAVLLLLESDISPPVQICFD